MQLDEDPDLINPFVIPYRHIAAGWALVGAGHFVLWFLSAATGVSLWTGVGLFQFAYVVPLYKRSTEWVGRGIKQASIITLLCWLAIVVFAFLSLAFGGYC